MRGRRRNIEPGAVRLDENGMAAGRAADGTELKLRFRGKSKARELIEKQQEEQRKAKAKKRRGKESSRGT